MPDRCGRCGEGEARICVSCADELVHYDGHSASPEPVAHIVQLQRLDADRRPRPIWINAAHVAWVESGYKDTLVYTADGVGIRVRGEPDDVVRALWGDAAADGAAGEMAGQ